MRQALIDTDILSELMFGKDENVVANARQYYRVYRQYTVSVVTIAELLAGQTQAGRIQDVIAYNKIESLLDVYSLDRAEAETAGRIVGALRANGVRLEKSDPYIAATALENDLELVTVIPGTTNGS